MSIEFKKFAIKLFLITFVVFAVGAIVFKFFLQQYYVSDMFWAGVFFFVVTLLVHGYQLKMARTNATKFTSVSMVMTIVKLFIYSVFTVVVLAFSIENAVAFVLVVMVLYVVFTVTEVTDLMKVVRKTKKDK